MTAQEARKAVEELNDTDDSAAVYMSVGTVVMQKPKAEVIAKVTEKIETLEIRIRSIEKQEKMLQEKFEKLQNQVRSEIEGRKAPEAA